METRLGNSSSRRLWADASYAQLAVFIRINADDYMLADLCDYLKSCIFVETLILMESITYLDLGIQVILNLFVRRLILA